MVLGVLVSTGIHEKLGSIDIFHPLACFIWQILYYSFHVLNGNKRHKICPVAGTVLMSTGHEKMYEKRVYEFTIINR